MKTIATFSQFWSQLQRQVRSAAHSVTAELTPDVIEVRVPHPDLNFDDFWAFGRTAD